VDPIRNPYTPNAGSRPPELTGRDQELEQFRVLVGRLKRGATDAALQFLITVITLSQVGNRYIERLKERPAPRPARLY
jgi:hypothetical protein